MTNSTTPQSPSSRRKRRVGIALGVIAAVLVVAGLAALVTWSLMRPASTTGGSRAASLGTYETAWASAMRKAGVEATFPAEPVQLERLRAVGRHNVRATFSAEEITALLNVYRYEIPDQAVALDHVVVDFPARGEAAISGSANVNGSSYSASLSGRAAYKRSSIVASGPIGVSVEGFQLRGARREQAVDQILGYLNAMLDDAPGLTLISAEIVKDGVEVNALVPDRLLNPDPGLSTEQKAATRP